MASMDPDSWMASSAASDTSIAAAATNSVVIKVVALLFRTSLRIILANIIHLPFPVSSRI
ncbi:hypothetical protein D3C81_2076480 [compost metagenome]